MIHRVESLPVPFIVGTGRSGTTLLRMMLDAHSTLAIPPETNFAPALEEFRRAGAGPAAEAMAKSTAWVDGELAESLSRHAREERPSDFGAFLRIFYRLYAERRGKPRWGDKSPYYIGGMALIQRHLPEAHFVHVVRDGRDFALSVIPLWFGPNSIADAAAEWTRTLRVAREQAERLDAYLEVRYEDLVCDARPTLERVCEFLRLEWEDSMLDYHLRARERIATEAPEQLWVEGRLVPRRERLDIHRWLAHPPRRDRIGRWKRELPDADVEAFERIAGEKLEQLGYEVGTVARGVGR